MERYFKIIEDGYIVAVMTGKAGETEITKEEYDEILSLIRTAPKAATGYRYRLKADLTWELAELPPEDVDPDLSETEAMDIIMGVAT